MAKSVNQLVTAIKENGEDFEWYPTTNEIVNALQNHLKAYLSTQFYDKRKIYKLLDIGCGNGSFFNKFCKEFMQKLNVEMARINNWVQDKTEAMAEMDIPVDIINSVWGSNLQIKLTDGRKLLGLPEGVSA